MADLASPYLGYLGDRISHTVIISSSYLISVVALILLLVEAPLWMIVFWIPISFVAIVASCTVLNAAAGRLSSNYQSIGIMSRHVTWQDMGLFLGPLLAYIMIIHASLQAMYLCSLIILIVSLLVWASNQRDWDS